MKKCNVIISDLKGTECLYQKTNCVKVARAIVKILRDEKIKCRLEKLK